MFSFKFYKQNTYIYNWKSKVKARSTFTRISHLHLFCKKSNSRTYALSSDKNSQCSHSNKGRKEPIVYFLTKTSGYLNIRSKLDKNESIFVKGYFLQIHGAWQDLQGLQACLKRFVLTLLQCSSLQAYSQGLTCSLTMINPRLSVLLIHIGTTMLCLSLQIHLSYWGMIFCLFYLHPMPPWYHLYLWWQILKNGSESCFEQLIAQ